MLFCSIFTSDPIFPPGSQSQDTDICTIIGTNKLCVQRDVIGVRGENVILPCWFNHREGNNIKNLSLVWNKYYNYRHNIIFRSFTKYAHEQFKGRIQGVGNPSEGDGMVRIRDLKMEDEGTYVCRFEFHEKMFFLSSHISSCGFEAMEGKRTRLRFVNSSTSWSLFCEAEAKPRPKITWWNPQGLLLNGSETKIISGYNITREDPEGNYSCLVQNQHGTGKGFVFYEGFEGTSETRGITGILVGRSSAIILVFLLVFVLIYYLCKKQGNPSGEE
uniref:Ig-like domain-containing protein n=1 Tax=Eptatretus burgeri TaxID=7764 RepID=A0A8C4QTV5_EPTBU